MCSNQPYFSLHLLTAVSRQPYHDNDYCAQTISASSIVNSSTPDAMPPKGDHSTPWNAEADVSHILDPLSLATVSASRLLKIRQAS